MNAPSLETIQSVEHLPLDRIIFPPNCREADFATGDLEESIQKVGLLEPIVVRRAANDNEFILLSGNRRLAAWKKVHKNKPIPAVVKSKTDIATISFENLAHNILREDIADADKAQRIWELVNGRQLPRDGVDASFCEEFPKTDKKTLARLLGMSLSHLNNLLRCHEGLAPRLKEHWKKNEGMTAWMIHEAKKDKDEQVDDLDELLEKRRQEKQAANGPKPKKSKKKDDEEIESLAKASMKDVREVLQHLTGKLEETPGLKGVDKAFTEGKVIALKFVLGYYQNKFAKHTNYAG